MGLQNRSTMERFAGSLSSVSDMSQAISRMGESVAMGADFKSLGGGFKGQR
tara:strand:- start:548 stop:700 length:153 start_codon:yes stop_codon:yes gene_type:complete